MGATFYTKPVRHVVWDDFVRPLSSWTVPDPSDPAAWEVRYDNDFERGKLTTRKVPDWVRGVLGEINSARVLAMWTGFTHVVVQPDLYLHGGGLQVMVPGGHLNCHLDGIVHPMRHWRRTAQVVCYCHTDWPKGAGGTFVLYDPDGNPVVEIEPTPGRLVVFENTDLAYHGVSRISPDAPNRVHISTSLLAPVGPDDTRTKALFMPTRCRH